MNRFVTPLRPLGSSTLTPRVLLGSKARFSTSLVLKQVKNDLNQLKEALKEALQSDLKGDLNEIKHPHPSAKSHQLIKEYESHHQHPQPINLHRQFYKTLFRPFIKVTLITFVTFYGMIYLWDYIDEDEK